MKLSRVPYGAAACRWIGRVIGLLIVALTVSFAIGEGMPNPFTQPVVVQIGFLALALILGGILAGWRWELLGGAVSLLGWSLFVLAEIRSPRNMNWFISALGLPGALYVTSALLRRCQERRPSASGPAR
jgi:hypothetical protein